MLTSNVHVRRVLESIRQYREGHITVDELILSAPLEGDVPEEVHITLENADANLEGIRYLFGGEREREALEGLFREIEAVIAKYGPLVVWELGGAFRAELGDVYPDYRRAFALSNSPFTDLTDWFDLEGQKRHLHLEGPLVETPWDVVFASNQDMPPRLFALPDRDVIAIGSGRNVATIRLSIGECVFADVGEGDFLDFLLLADLNRLVAISELNVWGLDADGSFRWALRFDDRCIYWRRDGNTLLAIDVFDRQWRIDIMTGSRR